jgi:hypothetical protein
MSEVWTDPRRQKDGGRYTGRDKKTRKRKH